MFDALQECIDRLSITLARSVVLDDATLHLLCSSPHYDDVDEARIDSLVNREPTEAQRAHLSSLRLNTNHNPVLLAPYPEIGFRNQRLCITIRSRVEVLGYLWIMAREPFLPSECYVIAEVVETVQHMLHNLFESISSSNAEMESQTLTLLAEDPRSRDAAATELQDLGMFNRSKWFVAIALDLPVQWTAWSGPSPRRTVFDAMWRALAAPTIDSYSFAASTPMTLIVLGYRNRPPRDSLATIGRAILRELKETNLDRAACLGVGAAMTSLSDVWMSFDQAVVASTIGRRAQRQCTFWEDEPLAASTEVMLTSPPSHLIPNVLARLSAASSDDLDLLSAYFEFGGNVAEMAGRLNVHRGTVYYRLKNFTESSGLSLDSDDSRFVLHAWLKLQRLRTLG